MRVAAPEWAGRGVSVHVRPIAGGVAGGRRKGAEWTLLGASEQTQSATLAPASRRVRADRNLRAGPPVSPQGRKT